MDNHLSKNKIKIAHIILVHQWPDQLKKLILSLQHPDVSFYIHVDKKTEETPFIKAMENIPHVTFIKKRVDVVWGGFSLIEAVIEGMKEVISTKSNTHINLISGADYPLTPAQEFVEFIQQNPVNEFFEFYPIETEWTEAIPRYTRYHFPDLKFRGKYLLEKIANTLLPARKMPDNMIPVGRLVWFTITTNLASHLLKTLVERKHLIPFFKLTWGTDEIIFPTLTFNSEFKNQMINRSLRYVNFFPGEAHPKTLEISDLNTIYLQKYFFARKFHPIYSKDLIEEINKRIKQNQP
jgi:hypothetical protein